MKKLLLLALLNIGFSVFSQDFAVYKPTTLKASHEVDGVAIKHIAPAKMIVLDEGGQKDSFYFDDSGKLKGVSGAGYSYEVPANKVSKKEGGKVVSSDAPTADFLNLIKTKLEKALGLLKK